MKRVEQKEQYATILSLTGYGESLFVNDNKDPRKRLVEMLHAISSKSNKEIVLQEMGQETGCIRMIICTIAFGMRVNCKGVQGIILLSPSIITYIQ